jgi:hypothetical protein
MYPFSYTGLKIVHDQQVQESLERSRLNAERATYRQGLFQAFEKLLARFTNQPGRKQEGPRAGCAW